MIWHWAWFLSRSHRDGEPGGVGPGGAGLQDALSGRVPRISARPDADLLEERAWGEAHVWVPAGLLGGLLHLHGASVPARREPVNVLMRTAELFQHGDCCVFTWEARLILPTELCTGNVLESPRYWWDVGLQPGIPALPGLQTSAISVHRDFLFLFFFSIHQNQINVDF